MADSRRGMQHKPVTEGDEEQKRKDRFILIGFFTLMVLIVIGMVFLSKFISGS